MAEVGIKIVTYNHEKVICKCIDSFLAQKTSFDFDITIYDDCSTDHTIEVLREKYGDSIKYHINKRNMGIGRNMYDALSQGNHRYRVLFAGDDWILENDSLQEMYDYLEGHKEASAVGDWCKVFDKDEKLIGEISPKCESYSMRLFLCGEQVSADPTMFRDIYDGKKDKWFYEINSESNEPQMLFAIFLKGELGVLHKYVRAYRFIKNDNADNYNSTHTAMDTFVLFRRVLREIENRLNMSGLFTYKIIPLTSNVIKMSFVRMIKKHNMSDMRTLFKTISLSELVKGFMYIPILSIGKGSYPKIVFKSIVKKHKKKFDIRMIGEILC